MDYLLPVSALFKTVALDTHSRFIGTLEGGAQESGLVQDGWLTELVFTMPGAATTLTIKLVSRLGAAPTESGKALLLIPMLTSPDVTVQATAVANTVSSSGGDKPMAAPMAASAATAITGLLTLDNPQANIPTTVSEFRFEGWWQDAGNWSYTIWFDHSNTKPLFPNWFYNGPGPDGWPFWTDIRNASFTSATGVGDINFVGYFPLPKGQVWEELKHHTIVLRQQDHDAWLSAEIYATQFFVPPLLPPIRYLWKSQTFWSGQTFSNGTNQVEEWFILNHILEGFF